MRIGNMARLLVVLGLAVALATASAAPVNTYWKGTTGDWFTLGNWTVRVPTAEDKAVINNTGTAQIAAPGAVCDDLQLGTGGSQLGYLELKPGGSLVARLERIGWDNYNNGYFYQTGGTNTVTGTIIMNGWGGTPHAEYHLSDGILNADTLQMAGYYPGTSIFDQSGGTSTVSTAYVGSGQCTSTFNISAGSLSVADFYLSTNIIYTDRGYGTGKMNITNAAADIEVSNKLSFGPKSELTAVPGSTIHMTGSALENQQTDPTKLAGLNNLTMIFEGGAADTDPFEVAGQDIGAKNAGFVNNFALAGLTLGAADVGRLQLVDNVNNVSGTEALYTQQVSLGPGSYLDLNGLNLYYFKGAIDGTATITGGTMTQVKTYWTGGTGDWFTSANWDAGVPVPLQTANISNGGTAQINDPTKTASALDLGVGNTPGHVTGNLELSAGALEATHMSVGVYDYATGVVTQTGGTCTVAGDLRVGGWHGSDGTYNLSDGDLSAQNIYLNKYYRNCKAKLIQSGGSVTVADTLVVGSGSPGSQATYEISAGSLTTPNLYVASITEGAGYGTLAITGAAADITVSNKLYFGPNSTFTAVPGSTIHMTGSALENQQTDPSKLAGLNNLTMIFEGGAADTDPFEVAGSDIGWDPAGFTNNFALNTLTLGGASTGDVRLVNSTDNRPGAEALYVKQLNVGAGSSLDLNGLNLYYETATIDPGATIVYNGGILNGQKTYWQAGTADWFTGGNWSGGAPPTQYQTALINNSGTAQIADPAKTATALYVGVANASGTVTGNLGLSAGALETTNMDVGCNDYDTGVVTQTGGTCTVAASLAIGGWSFSSGEYDLQDGDLSADTVYISRYYRSTGLLTQSGGTLTANTLHVGHGGSNYTQSQGTYEISGGILSVADLYVATHSGPYGGGRGTLKITDAAADITVSNLLSFGPMGELTAVPGSTIHMTGSAFENRSTDPAALAGLENLTLIFEGGTADVDPFEVACEDMGYTFAGFEGNFVLGGLTVGGVDVGRVRLVDVFDNQPGWTGDEALYVWDFNMGAGSYLDLNGLNLYYFHGSIDPDATVVGGEPMRVPEPATVLLVGLGAALVARRRRRE